MNKEEVIKFIKNGLIEEKYFKCPCCKRYTSFYTWLGCKEYNYGYEYPFEKYRVCFNHFLMHLRAKIRLSGDEKHINLLIEMFGKEESYKILNKMAEKNMIVALRLKVIVNKLKNMSDKLKIYEVKNGT